MSEKYGLFEHIRDVAEVIILAQPIHMCLLPYCHFSFIGNHSLKRIVLPADERFFLVRAEGGEKPMLGRFIYTTVVLFPLVLRAEAPATLDEIKPVLKKLDVTLAVTKRPAFQDIRDTKFIARLARVGVPSRHLTRTSTGTSMPLYHC